MIFYTGTFEQPTRGGKLNPLGLKIPGDIKIRLKETRKGWKGFFAHNQLEVDTPTTITDGEQMKQIAALFDRQIGSWRKHSTIKHMAGSADGLADRAACGHRYDPACEIADPDERPNCYECMRIWHKLQDAAAEKATLGAKMKRAIAGIAKAG